MQDDLEDDAYDSANEEDPEIEKDEYLSSSTPTPTPADPWPHLRRNPVARRAIEKLMKFQEEEDIQRFLCRIAPSQRKPGNGHFNSDCCFAGSPPQAEDGNEHDESMRLRISRGGCGPFLSCTVKHGRSNDFEEVPNFIVDPHLMRNAWLYGNGFPFHLQLPPRPIINTKGQGEPLKCRACPQTSIFLFHPDLWFADYKHQITYGRILMHKPKLRERIECWIPSDDFKDRIVWLRNRSNSLSKFQANHNRKMVPRAQANNGFVGITPSTTEPFIRSRKFQDAPDQNSVGAPIAPIMYGPSAIASLGGFSASPRKVPSIPQPLSNIKDVAGVKLPSHQNSILNHDPHPKDVPWLSIPWPSDNLRYYDDDSDPRMTQLLANTPFRVPSTKDTSEKIEKVLPSSETTSSPPPPPPSKPPGLPIGMRGYQNQGSKQLPRSSFSINTILKPMEYTIGTGRKTKSNLKIEQSPQMRSQETAGESSSLDIHFTKHGMGDSNDNKNSPTPLTTLETVNNGSEGERKDPVKSEKELPPPPPPKLLKTIESFQIPAPKLHSSNPTTATKSVVKAKPKSLQPKKAKPSPAKKPKPIRRFKKTISTVPLSVPKTKDKIMFT